MSKSAVSKTIIYEGGESFTVTVTGLATKMLDTLSVIDALSILWTVYIKSATKYYGCQIFAVKKSSDLDFNIYSIAGDEINVDFDVIIDGTNVVLNITNNETFNILVKGKRSDII